MQPDPLVFNPWIRVAGQALAIVRGRHSSEGTLVSAWPLLVEAGRRLGVEFPADLAALEALAWPCLPIDPRCWDLQDQAIEQGVLRHGTKAQRAEVERRRRAMGPA